MARRRLLTLWLGAAAILAAVAFVYAPSVRGGWLWDDDREISANPALRAPDAPANFWVRPEGTDFFPLKDTVEWAEWKLWGDRPAGYRAVTVALHALDALLLWGLLRRLFRLRRTGGAPLGPAWEWAAWAGALLFAVHPLAVESVAWIAELKNTLSLALVLAAFWSYAGWEAGRAPSRYVAALALFAAAMLSKTTVAMFPVVLLAFAAWRRGRIGRRDVLASAPFFAVSAILGLVTVRFQHGQHVLPGGVWPAGMPSRFADAGLAAAFYLWKTAVPAGLLPVYARWSVNPPRLWQFAPWLGFAVLAGWFWVRRRGWGRHALFGFGIFAINLVPVLGFVRMSYMRFGWVADHFAYLSLAAAAGLVAAGFGAALARLSGRGRTAALATGGLAAAVLALAARAHAAVYRDALSLWSYTLNRNPSAWVAENNLATALCAEGRLPEALPHFEAALRLNPDAPEVENDLGTALLSAGEPDRALPHLQHSVAVLPDSAEARYNLGNALADLGRYSEAVQQYEAALRLDPGVVEVLGNLGLALAHSGRLDEAVARYREALRIAPNAVTLLDNLGDAELIARRPDLAVAPFGRALRIDPGDAEAEYGLGNACLMSGRPADAVLHFEAALRLRPGFEAARENLDAARRAAAEGP